MMMGFGPDEWVIIGLSLRIAFWATLLSLPFGVFVALALARGRFRGRGLLNLVVHLPLVLPPVVTGYLLLIGFGAQGPFGQFFQTVFGVSFAFRWTGAALACAVMAFPLMVRPIQISLEAVDRRLEEAAATLGASRLRIFVTVTLPLMLPGIVTGAVLAFARALGEFGATITFVSNIPGQTQTIPTAIYVLLQVPGQENAAIRLIVVSIVLAAGALIASEWLARATTRRVRGQ